MKEILGVDEIPAFEVNDQTIPVLLQIISNHDAKKKQNSIIAHQMRQETEELKADSKHWIILDYSYFEKSYMCDFFNTPNFYHVFRRGRLCAVD